jgi:hypothetical protein
MEARAVEGDVGDPPGAAAALLDVGALHGASVLAIAAFAVLAVPEEDQHEGSSDPGLEAGRERAVLLAAQARQLLGGSVLPRAHDEAALRVVVRSDQLGGFL